MAEDVQRDTVARFLEQWRTERPDLDTWPLAIFGRLLRLSTHLQSRAEKEWIADLGLTWESFSILFALKRGGPPYELRPTDFYRESLLTSGTITNRIDRVEAMGWVTRHRVAGDGRGVIVRLTLSGKKLADKATDAHTKSLARVLGTLDLADRQNLTRLLSQLLLDLETKDD